jgi:hypothetical protein
MFADYSKKEFIQTLFAIIISTCILYFSIVGLFLLF